MQQVLHPLRADDLTLGGVHDRLPAGHHGKLGRGDSAARIVFSQHCVVAIVGCVHLFDHERDLASRLRHQVFVALLKTHSVLEPDSLWET